MTSPTRRRPPSELGTSNRLRFGESSVLSPLPPPPGGQTPPPPFALVDSKRASFRATLMRQMSRFSVDIDISTVDDQNALVEGGGEDANSAGEVSPSKSESNFTAPVEASGGGGEDGGVNGDSNVDPRGGEGAVSGGLTSAVESLVAAEQAACTDTSVASHSDPSVFGDERDQFAMVQAADDMVNWNAEVPKSAIDTRSNSAPVEPLKQPPSLSRTVTPISSPQSHAPGPLVPEEGPTETSEGSEEGDKIRNLPVADSTAGQSTYVQRPQYDEQQQSLEGSRYGAGYPQSLGPTEVEHS
eukprot:gene27772-35838_t